MILPAAKMGLFRKGDPIVVQTSRNAWIRVLNLQRDIIYHGPPTKFLRLPVGHYFVETTNDKTQFAILPDDYAGASFLGADGESGTSPPHTEMLRQIKPAWSRALYYGSAWAVVEPQRGWWDWLKLDTIVALCQQHRRKLVLTAWVRPSWLTDDNEFIPLYCEYLRRLCLRYGNKLYAIEIWNEPNSRARWPKAPQEWLPFESSAAEVPAAYIKVLSNAYFTIKSVNPGIKVYGPGWATPVTEDFIERFAKLGGQAYLDGFTFHDYSMGKAPPDQSVMWPGGLRPRIDQMDGKYRALFGARDLVMIEGGLYGRSALDIPNTPTIGSVLTSGLDWRRGMNRTIKWVVMHRAAGVKALLPHVLPLWTDNPANNYEVYGWEFGNRGPHPKTTAFLLTGYWLNNASFTEFRAPGSNAFLYAWQMPDSTSLLVAWALEGQSVPLAAGSLPSATDIFGHTVAVVALTEEPVLFRSSNPDASDLLRTVRSKIATVANLAPVFDFIPTQNAIAGQSLQFTVSATDPDNDPVTYSAVQLPSGATFDPDTRTFSWTPSVGASGPYDVTFVATDDQGSSTSNTVTVTALGSLFDGLIARWKLDEVSGTTAADSVGTNNGALVNFDFTSTSPWGRANQGRGLAFDGVNDFVRLDSSQLCLTNGFSLAMWIKLDNAAATGSFFSVRSSYLHSGFRFFVSGNSLVLQGETAAGWQSTTFADNAISSNVWYHVAVVYDHSHLSAYLNGALQGSVNWGDDFVMNPASNTKFGTEGGYYFQGVIDDPMIFGRTLTAFQIQTLYRPNNSAPLLKPKRVRAGKRVRIKLKAKDPDRDALAYSLDSLPTGATFDPVRRRFEWIPTLDQVGQYDLTASVTDGYATSSQPLSITVY